MSSDKPLLDSEDQHLLKYKWRLVNKSLVRTKQSDGKKTTVTLPREVLQINSPLQKVKNLNGNPWDCRRCNLEVITVNQHPDCQQSILLDQADQHLLRYQWKLRNGSLTRTIGRSEDKTTLALQREVLGLSQLDQVRVVFKDENPYNCQKSNLYISSISEDNRAKHQDPKGWVKDKKSGTYNARINKNGVRIHLGCFQSPEAAHDAYIQARQLIEEGQHPRCLKE